MTRRAAATGADEMHAERSQERRTGSGRPVGARTAVAAPDGPQILILDDFPTPLQVRVLGPNSGSTNRYALSAMRGKVQAWVKVEVGRQGIRPVPPPARVTLRYVMPDRTHRDADNFAVIAKPVIDALVRSGVLVGDNFVRLSQRVEFVHEKKARRLEIVIEEAPR